MTQGNSRKAFFRILRVATIIRNRQRKTAWDIAVELNVHVKTIRRDIEFLKDIGAPILFQGSVNGAWIWDESRPMPWYLGGKLMDPKL